MINELKCSPIIMDKKVYTSTRLRNVAGFSFNISGVNS